MIDPDQNAQNTYDAWVRAMKDLAEARSALERIATMTGSQSPAINMPDADWYRGLFYDCVGIAARALKAKD